MKSPPPPDASGAPHENNDSETTGLPAFKTWRALYIFVVAAFAAEVAVLAWLSIAFL